EASSYIDLMIGGLFLGIGGAVFSVGVTSLPKYYPKERHGFVNGIYGAGNIGTAISTFAAPVIATQIGWSMTVKLYLILLLIFALLNFVFGDRKEERMKAPIVKQIKSVYKNEKLWYFSLFYFITFGSFVAFTVYLPNFLVGYFELDKVDAGMRTAGFIAVATALRPVGGWLGDKFQPLFLLMGVFVTYTVAAMLLAFSPSIFLFPTAGRYRKWYRLDDGGIRRIFPTVITCSDSFHHWSIFDWFHVIIFCFVSKFSHRH